jgi:flagellar protein FlgJ
MDIKFNIVDPNLLVTQSQKPEPATGKKDDPEALRRSCQQFEAIFIQQLFKGMRATVPAGGLLENDRSIELYQNLMDQQVAETMARKQGLGIGEALLRQLQDKKQD